MKVIFTILLLCTVWMAKAQTFAHISGAAFTKEGLGGAAGFGVRKGTSSVGITGYYTSKYRTSINADLHIYLNNNKSGFIFFQPGVNIWKGVRPDIKAGFGYIGKNSTDLYFTTGIAAIFIKDGWERHTVVSGFASIGVKL